MNSITAYAPQITILDSVIKVINGLYCLNDLHKASGNNKKHQPSNFMRNSEVMELADELIQTSGKGIEQVTQRINGGEMRGTYACKELVYRYAMWISPKFALLVIRTFDQLVTGELKVVGNRLTTEQTLPLRIAVNKLVTKSGIMYPDAYKIVHKQFGVNHIKDLTLEQLSQAIEYIYDRVHSLSTEKTPISSFTHNQYIMNVKQGVMDYVYSLQKAIVDSGSPLPKYPAFDVEEICQAFIVSMIRHNRMMLSFNYEGKPNIGFVPQQHAVVSSENIADVVQFADKSQLPNIINEAVKRLGQ